MPVVPSYYSSSRSYFPRSSPSSSLFLNRTTSLDRSSYASSYSPMGSSGYGSSYSSSSYSSASKPPRPSYSSSYYDSYKSRREASSPIRSSTAYTRVDSGNSRESEGRSYEKTIGHRTVSDASSRYASSTVSSRMRENSSSRDSGYGSRLTSRDRSLDIKNGNVIDSKVYGPSPSSYASNYRWERPGKGKDRSVERQSEDESVTEKVKVSDRVRNYESFDDDTSTPSYSGSSVPRSYARDEIEARRKRDEDNISARRQRLGLSPIRKSRSKTPDVSSRRKYANSERNGNEEADEDEEAERQKPVSELRRRYDASNHNGYSSSTKEDDESSDELASSVRKDNPTIRRDSPETTTASSSLSSSRRRTDSGTYSSGRDSPPTSSKYTTSDSNSSSRYNSEGTRSSYLESPSFNRRNKDISPQSRSPEGRGSYSSPSSTLTNGYKHLDDPSCHSYSSSSPYSRSTLPRSERVRERIAARLAREIEDDDSPSNQKAPSGDFSETSGLVGLRNIGNTCFMNSVTQCLSNTRCLLEYMVKEGYSGDINTSSLSTMKGDLIRAFGNLIREMWTEGDANRALNTGPFKSQIQRFAPAFSGYQQHDAQEFLRKLLEGLHEDVNRVTTRPRAILEDIDDDLSDDRKAMESWKRYLRFDDSKIVDMFVGQLKSSLKCSVCSHTSVTFDPFWDLSLPIPNKSGTVKLNQCLDLFTKEEVMDGDERPTCSKCKERRKMTKSFSIQKFPRILVLHLKRFSPTERWRGKLSCTVEFPLENLDLSRYASSALSSCTYNLNGVANHSGTTYSGHYTAFCKHPYSSQWHEYNDSRVSSIAARRVCSSEAYVLFYELALSSASRL